jgi:hypothetical protein
MSTTPYYDKILAEITDDTVRDVYTTIRDSHGKEHAISKEMVSQVLWQKYTPTTDRTLRKCVEILREKYSILICTLSDVNGYFMPANRAELNEYFAEERSRLDKQALKLRKLENAARTWDFAKPREHIPSSVEAVQAELFPAKRVEYA